MSWLDDVNRAGPEAVGLALGLQRTDRHLGPCPACNEDRRSRTDRRRGPIFVLANRLGWKCGLCGAGGGAVQLASLRLFGAKLPAGDERWRELREECARHGWCDGFDLAEGERRASREAPKPVVATLPPRPLRDELRALWRACRPVTDDHEVAGWLTSRGLDPAEVADRKLARALPPGAALPRWARVRGTPWSEGWRCILPAYGPTGRVESFRARWVRRTPPIHDVKSAAAAAGGGSATGLVLADAVGASVLASGQRPTWWPRAAGPFEVVVAEGEPDFLTWATRRSGDTAPAVFGIWNGSWTNEIAGRVPDSTRVVIRVHHDDAGDRYARRIHESLLARCGTFRAVAVAA